MGKAVSNKKIFFVSVGVKLFFLSLSLLLIITYYEPHGHFPSYSNKNIDTSIDVAGQYDSLGFTELSKAASYANMDIVTYYINQRLPLNVQAQNIDAKTGIASGNTPAHFALWDVNWDPNFEIAKMLIRAGAKVTIPNSQGNQLIHTLIVPVNLCRRLELLGMLLQHGSDINAQNNEGETMAHMAIYDTEKDWICILSRALGFLIDFSVKNNKGETVYDLAKAVGNNTDTQLDALFNRKNITICARSGFFLTCANSEYNQFDCGQWACSPLARNVTISGSTITVVDSDLFIDERDIMGLNLLMIAVIKGDQKFAQQVLSLASRQGRLNQILNGKVDDQDQNSALHLALLHQDPDMFHFLISQNGIIPNIQNGFGDTPLHYVFKLDDQESRKKVARDLFAAESTYLNNLVKANKLTKQQAIKQASINTKNNNGNGFTPLELAVLLPPKEAYDFIVNFLIGEISTNVPSWGGAAENSFGTEIETSTYDAAIALAYKKSSVAALGDFSFCMGTCSVGDVSNWTDAKIYYCIACELKAQRDIPTAIRQSAALH